MLDTWWWRVCYHTSSAALTCHPHTAFSLRWCQWSPPLRGPPGSPSTPTKLALRAITACDTVASKKKGWWVGFKNRTHTHTSLRVVLDDLAQTQTQVLSVNGWEGFDPLPTPTGSRRVPYLRVLLARIPQFLEPVVYMVSLMLPVSRP